MNPMIRKTMNTITATHAVNAPITARLFVRVPFTVFVVYRQSWMAAGGQRQLANALTICPAAQSTLSRVTKILWCTRTVIRLKGSGNFLESQLDHLR